MNTHTPTPKVRVHIDLTVGERLALQRLAEEGYSIKTTKVSVVRELLQKAWEEKFPGEEFPTG